MGPGSLSTRQVIEFRTALDSVRVDREGSIIRGVALITKGTARGHELDVDDDTLNQILGCARERGQVPVKANHKSGVGDVTGYVTNFWIEGDKLRGDWHLLKSYPQREQFLETAERMPNGVGLSVAFIGPDKPVLGNDGRKKARCSELLACDYVTMPAANPDGLFEARVDNPKGGMATNPNSPEPTLAQVLEQLQALNQRLDASDKANQDFRRDMQLAIDPPALEDVLQMSDEQLAEIGLTPEDVQGMLEQISAEQEANPDADPNADPANPDANAVQAGEGEGEGEGAPAAAPAATASALSRIEKAVTMLEGRFEKADKDKLLTELAAEFDAVGAKIDELQAENAMLREANQNAGKPVSRGVEALGVKYFSRDKQEGAYERKVFEFQKGGKSKVEAFNLARKEDPEAYRDYLKRLNIIEA